jgi:hypothetical protein
MRLRLPAALGGLLLATLSAGCGPERPDELDVGTAFEGLSADDAEREAARALANADAERRDFEGAEGRRTSAGTSGSLRPQSVPLGDELGGGTWAYAFRVTTDGVTSTELDGSNQGTSMFGASAFKLFTGLAAFANHTVAAPTLTYTLRTSSNQLANFAMCMNGIKLGGYKANCRSVTNATPTMRMEEAISATLAFHREQGVVLSPAFTMTDGSGLQTTNRLTADDLVAVLMEGRRHEGYARWRDMLAQPGKASTLLSRLKGYEGKVFAKTGTYHEDGGGVKVLAGYGELSRGRTLVFSVIGNGVGDPDKAMDRIELTVKKAITAAERE